MSTNEKSKWRETGDWVVGVLSSPRIPLWGAFLLTTFIVAVSALYIFSKEFGFAEVMHWLVLREPAPLPAPSIQVEQFRSMEP